ncbi:hypothetical protein [Gloeothece verrucosa]|uniref:Uncharacterized protein n=1 Tax=Gloeothece verrucosa (strain PCC 7822) TaxID=497965 RepID=E0UNF1_GLOV7|nr:hypothetical protein [Gloeothece verrucosa]ADN18481.1 hypothetical protein Cyan7822_6830 [Gloeothece verrucosa PCC 7822]
MGDAGDTRSQVKEESRLVSPLINREMVKVKNTGSVQAYCNAPVPPTELIVSKPLPLNESAQPNRTQETNSVEVTLIICRFSGNLADVEPIFQGSDYYLNLNPNLPFILRQQMLRDYLFDKKEQAQQQWRSISQKRTLPSVDLD